MEGNIGKSNNLLYVGLALVAVLVLGLVFFARDSEAPAGDPDSGVLNPFAGIDTSNPLEGSANPYENIKVNPFE